MLVYGKNVAMNYLEKGTKVNKIYLAENFDDQKVINLIKKHQYSHSVLSKIEINKIAKGNHQGIILDVPNQKTYSLEQLLSDNADIVVILDHIEDPHNLGAIARTCEAAGIKNIIIPNKRCAMLDGVVNKTSAGTVNNLQFTIVSNLRDAIVKLKARGYWIIGTEMNAPVKYSDQDYSGKIAIVVGNEGHGMTPIIKNECDYLIQIPMFGTVNSLNASVAAAIVIFEAVKNRKE